MVSVIIPCYNGETVINRSIESVFIQDYENIELIIVDDGSTDNSKEIICSWEKKFREKGFTLRYVFQNNSGLGSAVDTGLKYVSGKYLSLLDADDYFLPGSIRKRADFLDNHPDYVGVKTSGWELKGDKKTQFNESEKNKSTTDLFTALLYDDALNWAGSYMIRTDILFEFYPDRKIYPSKFGQNMQILLPVAYRNKFGYIDEPLMVYVIQEESHSHASTEQEQFEKADRNFYGYLDIYQNVIRKVVKNPQELKQYENRFMIWKYRHECDKALRKNDMLQLKRNLSEWEKIGNLSINDKVKYYKRISPIRALLYRIIRRIQAFW